MGIQSLKRKASSIRKSHPRKSRATVWGAAIGIAASVITGCAGFPIASTLRLVCASATGVVDIIDKVQANAASVDSGRPGLDASADR